LRAERSNPGVVAFQEMSRRLGCFGSARNDGRLGYGLIPSAQIALGPRAALNAYPCPLPPIARHRPRPALRHCRRYRGQSWPLARGEGAGGGVRRRYRDVARIVPFGLSARGSRPQPAFQEACRTACETLARETGDGGPAVLVGLPWAENGALYTPMPCSTRPHRRRALQGGSAQLRVFDEKRVFAPGRRLGRSRFAACASAFRSARTFGGRTRSSAYRDGGEILLCQRLAYERGKVSVRQNIAVARVVESGPADDLSQRGRRPGRMVFEGASSRSTPTARWPSNCRPSGKSSRARCGSARGGWRCVEGERRSSRRATRPITRLRAGPARLCREQPLSGVVWGCRVASTRRSARDGGRRPWIETRSAR